MLINFPATNAIVDANTLITAVSTNAGGTVAYTEAAAEREGVPPAVLLALSDPAGGRPRVLYAPLALLLIALLQRTARRRAREAADQVVHKSHVTARSAF